MGPVGERRSLPGLKPNPTFTANAARFTMALHGLRLLVLLLALCSAPRGYARHQYTSRIPNGSRVPCPEAGDSHCQTAEESCGGVGHASCAGGATSPALNAFGKARPQANLSFSLKNCGNRIFSFRWRTFPTVSLLSAGFARGGNPVDEGAVREGLGRGRIQQRRRARGPLLRVERGGFCTREGMIWGSEGL